jgi:hypothetical protein
MVEVGETDMSDTSRSITSQADSQRRIADSLERGLKIDRSLTINEKLVPLVRQVCLDLGINPRIGSPRHESGWRVSNLKLIWFTDQVQKERFIEALSLLDEDPKDLEEENIFADRRSPVGSEL